MPKMKTNSAVKRRFHVTGTGKIMRSRVGKSHLRRRKTKRTKQSYSRDFVLADVDYKRIKPVLPKGLR